MSVQSFFLKRMLQSKLKGLPVDQQDKLIAAIEKNPELFQNIALEIQEKMKQDKDQMAATMDIMQKYKDDLKSLMG